MSEKLIRLTRSLIETWVRLYTLGLPESHRRLRLEAIRSDMDDQISDARDNAVSPLQVGASLIDRSLRGALDDVTWRLFEARRFPRSIPVIETERSRNMTERALGYRFYVSVAAVAWLCVVVLAVTSLTHSLAYAGGLVVLVSLAAWVLEARVTAENEAPPSVWPPLLAVGIVALAASFVFTSAVIGLVLALPVAVGLTIAAARSLVESRATHREQTNCEPVSSSELAHRSAQGDALAIESSPAGGVTRRAILRGSFGLGVASVLATMGGVVVDFLWQRNVAGFGGVVTAGLTSDFPPGTKTRVREGKFWIVNLTEAQGGPGFLALWQKCPHLGCVVPWNERFVHVDPDTGRQKEGWFRCPCHQSTYNDAGVRVFGPAPRSMDRMALRITKEGIIEVDTGDISNGAEDNAAFAVRAR